MLLTLCLSPVLYSYCINAVYFSICKEVDKEFATAVTTGTVTIRILLVKAVPTKVIECDIFTQLNGLVTICRSWMGDPEWTCCAT